MSILGIIFLVIFCLVLFGTYIVIRRGLLNLRTAGGLCAVGTVTALIAFGLAEDLQLLHALAVGIVVGLIFSGAVVVMAAFFLANQPPAEMDAYLSSDDRSHQ